MSAQSINFNDDQRSDEIQVTLLEEERVRLNEEVYGLDITDRATAHDDELLWEWNMMSNLSPDDFE